MSHAKSRFLRWGLLFTSTTLLCSVSAPTFNQPSLVTQSAIAQPANTFSKKTASPLFENLVLSPNLKLSPQVLKGISGGTEETQKKSGKPQSETGPCLGFIDTAPDHKVTLNTGFNYLKLRVLSPGDTILLVKGPGGSWCSDDVKDRNPEISGQWLAGTYEIWVGSYEVNTSYPYLLELTEVK